MAFTVASEMTDGTARLTLAGELDGSAAGPFREAIERLPPGQLKRLVLLMNALTYMASAGLRVLVFARQKLGSDVDIYLVGVADTVRETIVMTGFQHSVIMVDEYDAAEVESL